MIPLLYIPFCIFYAWLNARWIAKEKHIYHGLNGAIHIVVAAVVGWFVVWYHAITVLLIARVAFDWALNLFRRLPLGYVPIKPKSIADKLEKWVFKMNGILPKVIYIVIIIILIVI